MTKESLSGKLQATSSLTPASYPSQEEIEVFMRRMMNVPDASTETVDPRYHRMDTWRPSKMLDAFAEGQLKAIAAVFEARPQIEKAAKAIIDRVQPSGRLIYVGAGTSGRLGALDGMELSPTFGFPENRIVFAMAEDPEFKTGTSREGREDHTWRAVAKAHELKLTPSDVIIALAASGSTPYTRKFVEEAKQKGSLTIGISNNPEAQLLKEVDAPILLNTGAESIRGSTRMIAGTAQKSALTLLSSLAMAKAPGIHGVHDGMMINMPATPNIKLEKRAVQTVMNIAECDEEHATEALIACDSRMKNAILVVKGSTPEEAQGLLDSSESNLRAAMLQQKRNAPQPAKKKER